LAVLFVVAGIAHLATPQPFNDLMPAFLPSSWWTTLTFASGLVELVCAYGLLRQRTWAPWLSVALLCAVFPANVQMALWAGSHHLSGAFDNPVIAYVRLPFQVFFIAAALAGRRPKPSPWPAA
jgi:uncharacterized membrane protein